MIKDLLMDIKFHTTRRDRYEHCCAKRGRNIPWTLRAQYINEYRRNH